MIIEYISAYNFRNYEKLNLEFDKEKSINLIHSPNGMGKTNLLELIYYFSYLRSFRNVQDKELIKKGEYKFHTECTYNNKIINNIIINYYKKKEVLINNKKVVKFSEILGRLISVLFCNEDIFIINGSPNIRRKFFDIFISTVDNKYLHCLRKFQEILKQKNFILKNNKTNEIKEILDIYNIQLAKHIFYIQKKRAEIINEISKIFQENFNSIGKFNDKVKIIYSPSIKIKNDDYEEITKFYNENIKKEIDYGFSIFGPHRDNYLFLINGILFPKYASLGQTRLASVVLKFAQSEYYKRIFNVIPILLLDDVILELDNEKQMSVIEKISDYKQIFLTVTDRSYIELFKNKEIINEIEIKDGKIK